ncbi:MAG: hypothetical protein ACP5FR_00785 [Candidatus Micrarchaeia archaeon]
MATTKKTRKNSKSSNRRGHSHTLAIDAAFVGLNSLFDLARYALGGGSNRHISAIRQNGSYKIIANGEKVNGIQIIYYYDSAEIGKFFLYGQGAQNENVELRDSIAQTLGDYSTIKVPIVELLKNPYTEPKKAEYDILLVEVGNFDSFVKSLINDSQYGGSSAKVYSFEHNKERYIGSFELLKDSGKIFAYTKIDKGKIFNYIKYDFNKDSIELVDTITEKTFTYVRVINLAEPFPFFQVGNNTVRKH